MTSSLISLSGVFLNNLTRAGMPSALRMARYKKKKIHNLYMQFMWNIDVVTTDKQV